MARILIDTNFLVSAVQFRIDAFEQLREFGRDFAVLDLTIKELDKISSKKGRAAAYARIALQLVKKKNVRIVKGVGRSTDNAIVRFADKHGCIVATNDRKLIKRLKNKGIKIIRLRQKKYLATE